MGVIVAFRVIEELKWGEFWSRSFFRRFFFYRVLVQWCFILNVWRRSRRQFVRGGK